MLSKVLLSVLLAVGPVFIVAALFRRGVGFTQAWVGQVLTYMFVNILIMVLMNFAADSVFGLIHRGMDNQRPALGIGLEVVFLGLVMLYAATQIPTLAGGLAGGMAAPVSGMLGRIPTPASAVRGVQKFGQHRRARGMYRHSKQRMSAERERLGLERQRSHDGSTQSGTSGGGRAYLQTANSVRRR